METKRESLTGPEAIKIRRELRVNTDEIPTHAKRSETFDWIKYCRELSVARLVQENRLREKAALTTASSWNEHAERFRDTTLQEIGKTDRLLEFLSTYVTPEKTLLDVGAGTGRHALPLARLAKRIIAVEPSEGMRRFMKVEAVRLQLNNLTIVPKTWEEAEVEPCDIAYSVHVLLHTTGDVARFLEKLRDHAKEYCVLIIGTAQQNLRLLELWKLVHGEERCPHPSFVEYFNAIYQAIGVCPNIEVTPSRIGRYPAVTYRSIEEAVNQVARQILLSQGAPEIELVRSYLKDHLVIENGRLFLPGPTVPDAIFWWDNRPGSPNLARISTGLWEWKKKSAERNLGSLRASWPQEPAFLDGENRAG